MLTTVLLEKEGSDVARSFTGLQIPLRIRDFVCVGGWGGVQIIIPFTVSYNECLDVAISQFSDARSCLLHLPPRYTPVPQTSPQTWAACSPGPPQHG